MAWLEKQLAQAEVPSSTGSIYAGPASGVAIVRQIVVSNHEASAYFYSLWHDDDGTTYDDTTNLCEDISLGANSFTILGVFWPIDSAGNIAAKCLDAVGGSGAANKLTITLYGVDGIS